MKSRPPTLRQFVETGFGGPTGFAEYVARHRRVGVSWRGISHDLSVNHNVDVSDVTLANWFKGVDA